MARARRHRIKFRLSLEQNSLISCHSKESKDLRLNKRWIPSLSLLRIRTRSTWCYGALSRMLLWNLDSMAAQPRVPIPCFCKQEAC